MERPPIEPKGTRKRPVLVSITPTEDPKSQLSLIYERLAKILTLKIELAVQSPAVRFTFATRIGELVVEESRLIEQAKRLEERLRKPERARRASVLYFPPPR